MATRGRGAPEEFGKTVAALLDNERASRGLSQTALGKAVGVSQPQLSAQLRGLKPMTLDEFRHLCAALELTPSKVIILSDK